MTSPACRMTIPELRIGADPEVFVRKGKTYVSAHIFPCGTKMEPTKTKHGHVQVDGMALEFNVEPATTRIQFIQNTKNTFVDLLEIVKKFDPSCELDPVPVAKFDQKYMDSLPPFAKALGCNPDFNAYTKDTNLPPDGILNMRTGAGHVHFGWTHGINAFEDEKHFDECCSLAKQLDYYLGLRSLDWDKDNERRQMYGKAGCFRPKPYGMEYRVLSNAWLESEHLIGDIFTLSHRAFENWRTGKFIAEEKYGDFARKAIDQGWRDWRNLQKQLVVDMFPA